MGPLTSHRQSLAVAKAAICSEVDEPLDVHGDFAPEVAFDHVVAVDDFANLKNLGVRKLVHPLGVGNARLLADLFRVLRADPVDVAEGDDDPLVGWYVDACNSGHACFSSCSRGDGRGGGKFLVLPERHKAAPRKGSHLPGSEPWGDQNMGLFKLDFHPRQPAEASRFWPTDPFNSRSIWVLTSSIPAMPSTVRSDPRPL